VIELDVCIFFVQFEPQTLRILLYYALFIPIKLSLR